MSYHISTFGMRLKNIAKVALFTELVRKKLPISLQSKNIVDNIANKSSFSLRILRTPKFIKETGEHVRIKKPLYPKDRDIFDFMLRAPNDDSPVVDNPILNLPEETSKTCKGDTGTMTRRVAPKGPGAEVEYIDKLLGVVNIEGFDVLYPTLASQNIFSLRC